MHIILLPYFEKSKWTSISPEYDPFKYTSFPLNAAEQSYRLSRKLKQSILDHQAKGTLAKLPPVMTFQSAVDSTVIVGDLLEFYETLPRNGHELIVFDTNQKSSLRAFMKTPPLGFFDESRRSEQLGYSLAIITNKNPDSAEVVARTKDEYTTTFQEIPLNLSWPDGVYSLSHLAILFPLDHPLYGINPARASQEHVQLGNISLRGERNVLRISAQDLMRLRCNPFLDYVESRVRKAISLEDNRKKGS